MLINCPECRKEVSTRAAACPHCGAPVTATEAGARRFQIKSWFAVVIIGFGLVGMMSAGMGNPGAAVLNSLMFCGGLIWFLYERRRV